MTLNKWMVAAGLAAYLVLFAAANNLSAGELELREISNGGISDAQLDLSNTRTFDILLTTASNERILSQQIWLRLTQGRIVHHPMGSLDPPSLELIGQYPAIAFDTFLASGVPDASVSPTIVPGTSDKLGHSGSTPEVNTDQVLDVLWGPELGLNTKGATDYLSARITLSNDAAGMLSYQNTFYIEGSDFTYERIDVPIIPQLSFSAPEPSSLILLGLSTLIGFGRSRRALP